MTRTERETLERLAALMKDLAEPKTWICLQCSYIALYTTRKTIHERTTEHTMKESEEND